MMKKATGVLVTGRIDEGFHAKTRDESRHFLGDSDRKPPTIAPLGRPMPAGHTAANSSGNGQRMLGCSLVLIPVKTPEDGSGDRRR